MLANAGIYAVKKRKKPVQKPKKVPGADAVVKSNPSKRHRDRLNGELDRLTDLLPFSEDVRSRLDKLSVLRLSVGFLRVKSFFKATMKKAGVMFPAVNGVKVNGLESGSEGDLLLQALNGFVMVVTSEGLVFYASPTVQDYLGFHQSDVVHQSVYDLIHTDDRPLFRQQLHFALNPQPLTAELPGDDALQFQTSEVVKHEPDHLPPENSSFLERSFVCRFRCLLDNSSGFLALKFQGRLKYLHGQITPSDSGTRVHPQLALFSIAVPVQASSILEIRAKTLIFQTKHKLDFTPMGIDNRGKVVLGYTEIELCMRGSGYQFIHAADMMHCADNHLRMIKTGESGLTVFRLLTKASTWVWVQANAKLVYKGGRPDFIIARQRALVNAEGEEHLRQRSLQLPFSFTTGEAVLYDTGPSLDLPQMPGSAPKGHNKATPPTSLLGCFLNQDEAAYAQMTPTTPPPLPLDEVFMESRALVNVPSDPWPAAAGTGPMALKEEEDESSVVAMIDTLEHLAQDGDLCSALRGLEVDEDELMAWENALHRLSQEQDSGNGDGSGSSRSDLDSLLTNDILAFMDNVLFKGSPGDAPLHADDGLSGHMSAVDGDMTSLFAGADLVVPDDEPDQTFVGCAQKLSHYGPMVPQTASCPSQLLQSDVFGPALEPQVLVGGNNSAPFVPCARVSTANHVSNISYTNHVSYANNSSLTNHFSHANHVNQANHVGHVSQVNHANNSSLANYFTPANNDSQVNHASLANHVGHITHGNHVGLASQANYVSHANHASLANHSGHVDASQTQVSQPSLPPLVPRVAGSSVPIGGPSPCFTGGMPLQRDVHQWTTNAPAPPLAVPTLSSCMFEKSSPPLANGGHGPGPASMDQSPVRGSCYFQWGPGNPVVGSAIVAQQNDAVSPPGRPQPPPPPPLLLPIEVGSSAEQLLAMQHYQEGTMETQMLPVPADSTKLFSMPSVIDGNVFF